jgi:hypothetical protein
MNFTIPMIINEKNRYLDVDIKFGANLFYLTWEKKRKFKTCHMFYEEKGEFGGS